MTSVEISVDTQALDELNTREARELHEAINGLSACGVGRIVNLPQIIVVGEQSSGKSSVLEALCHIRFPVKEGLCTRFATELVLRPSSETRVNATIRYADKNRPPFRFERSGFDEKDLPELISQAKEHMGLDTGGKGFSKDILRLEIEGPRMYPLTLVDLPGLFHADTETQSLSGKETVDALVSGYMKKKNSIILTVITADRELASHAALLRVKTVDPNRERTIGVITKPDLVLPGSSKESVYVKLAKNLEGAHKLELGWHVVRNRTELETDTDTRDEVEDQFFRNAPWSSVPKQSLGISALRKRLSRVLYDHIRKNLPTVIHEIEKNLLEREAELAQLGNSRAEVEEMRSFLIRIASEFQRLIRDGIQGRYDDPFFGDLDNGDLKFRALLRNFNRAFDYIISTKGSSRTIKSPNDALFPPRKSPAGYLQEFLIKYPYDFPTPVVRTEKLVLEELQQQASVNQGTEFPGQPNKDLAIRLFQEQSRPWAPIARFHVERVTIVAKSFVDEVFKHIAGDPETNPTTEIILSTCVDPFFENQAAVLERKLVELLRPYTSGYSVALDDEFHDAYSHTSMERMADCLYDFIQEKKPGVLKESGQLIITKPMLSAAIKCDDRLYGGEFGAQTVVDMMRAYYETARRTFTTNVINLAIEGCLVADIPSILTPTDVSVMTDERLRELGSEAEDIQDRRNQLKEDTAVLRNGLTICQKYRPRGVTTLPSTSSSSAQPRGRAPSVLASAAAAPAGTTPAPTMSSGGGLFGSLAPNTASSSPKPSQTVLTGGLFGTPSAAGGKDRATKPTSGSLVGETSASASSQSFPLTGGLFGGTGAQPPPKSSSAFGSFGSFGSSSAFGSSPATHRAGFGSSETAAAAPSTPSTGLFGSKKQQQS